MLKIGDRFAKLSDFETAVGKCFPARRSFIKTLPNHPDYSCAKQIFYNRDFPETSWWNEFEGVDRTLTAANWKNLQWLCSDKTNVVHEIFTPLRCPQKPGGGSDPKNDEYHPVNIVAADLTKRLILGNFRYKRGK